MENHPEFHQTVRQATTHKFQTGERKGVGGHGGCWVREKGRERSKLTKQKPTTTTNKPQNRKKRYRLNSVRLTPLSGGRGTHNLSSSFQGKRTLPAHENSS